MKVLTSEVVMLLKALRFVWSHKLASAAFLVPVAGYVLAPLIIAYQERKKDPRPQAYPPVRDAVDEPVAPPTIDELPLFTKEGEPWTH